jgi:glutathione S-transferase
MADRAGDPTDLSPLPSDQVIPSEGLDGVVQWNAIVEQGGISALADAFRNSNPAFAGRAAVGPQNYDQIPELAERGRARAEAFFNDFDRHLEGRKYAATEDFTFADITAQGAVDFARMARHGIP